MIYLQGIAHPLVPTPFHLLPVSSTPTAVLVNDQLVDWDTALKDGDRLEWLYFEDVKGRAVFWHSAAHLLAQAIKRLYPDALPVIGPATDKGFFYDFGNLSISKRDFPRIEREMTKITSANYRLQRSNISKQQANEMFSENKYKLALIKRATKPLTIYQQGEFSDLCLGPHLPYLGQIGACVLLNVSGSSWEDNTPLLRIHAIAFPSDRELQLYQKEKSISLARDHRLLGPKLALISFPEQAPGGAILQPAGIKIWDRLLQFWRDIHHTYSYQEIKTPPLLQRELWERSGHWDHYRENMYLVDENTALKPMNCPGALLHYRSIVHSYRNLPLRIAEIGHVFRKELSGALHGLCRMSTFHQDDAHIFLTEEQLEREIDSLLALSEEIYDKCGLKYICELSTRPPQSLGDESSWQFATKALETALIRSGLSYTCNKGEGAFYGPKIDLHVEDALGRSWQCGTIQLDMQLPKAFDLTYDSEEGVARPLLIHRAVFGSVERFLAILIEHFAGKFPLWLSPYPLEILPIADRHISYAEEIGKQIANLSPLSSVVVSPSISIGKRIRQGQLRGVNYSLIVGDEELKTNELSLRLRNGQSKKITLENLCKQLNRELTDKLLASPLREQSSEEVNLQQ